MKTLLQSLLVLASLNYGRVSSADVTCSDVAKMAAITEAQIRLNNAFSCRPDENGFQGGIGNLVGNVFCDGGWHYTFQVTTVYDGSAYGGCRVIGIIRID